MEYLAHILVLAAIYVISASSLNLLVGHAGILSLAQAAFVGIGAYVSALAAVDFGLPFTWGVMLGSTVAGMVSLGISLSAARLHGDYLVVATFGFQIILFNVLRNWVEVTHGPLGISEIPAPRIGTWLVDSSMEYAVLSSITALLVLLIVRQISTSPFGRVLHAIREDEIVAKALGKNTLRYKVTVFAVSAALAAVGGSLYAHYISYIDPTSFTLMESILIISMVIIGGAGSNWGPLIGAFALVTLPEALRFVGLPSSMAANLRQILYGTALVVMMIFRPRGLVGTHSLGR